MYPILYSAFYWLKTTYNNVMNVCCDAITHII